MTKTEAAQILAILKAAYPNSYRGLTKEEATGTVSVWAAQFSDMPASVVMIAINKLISTNTFPPGINEVKSKIRGLYWEAWSLLDQHDRGFKLLTNEKLNAVREILKVCEPMRTRENLEPSLTDILGAFEGYITSNNMLE